MPTVFTHAFVATAATNRMPGISGIKLWLALVVSSVLPDADVIGWFLGIPYGSLFGHRGFSHSLTFALLWSVLAVLVGFHQVPQFSRDWWKLIALFFLVTASHGILDAFTNGGLGIAFFSPFITTRYFFPWRPIQVSVIGAGSFFSGMWRLVFLSEFEFVWWPIAVVWLGLWLGRKMVHQASNTTTAR